MAVTWTDLPAEVKLKCFADAEPSDLGRLSRLSKYYNELIKGNKILFRDVYLKHWDDPSEHPSQSEFDWERGVHEAVTAAKISSCNDIETQRRALPELARAVTEVSSIATASGRTNSRNITYLHTLFNKGNISRLAQASSLFDRAHGYHIHHESDCSARSQQIASAKLHCLYGVPQLQTDDAIDMYPYAASKIYDLRNYTKANRWGPFMDDGSDRVDWEKLEAIMLVLGHNIQRIDSDGESSLARLWRTPFSGTAPYSYKPVAPSCPHAKHGPAAPWCRTKPDPELEKQDPYGISGTWLRVVCFLDYRDLYNYNFGNNAQPRLRSEPRHPLNTDEAVRLIVMTFVVTGIHHPPSPSPSSSSSTTPMPIVSFTGTARALHSAWDPNANSQIRGTVSTTPEGEVRWTSVSVYHGDEERWKSEGIQVGGVRSARGVLGSWFDKDYAHHGPAGPTAFWKIRDDVNCEEDGGRREGEGMQGVWGNFMGAMGGGAGGAVGLGDADGSSESDSSEDEDEDMDDLPLGAWNNV